MIYPDEVLDLIHKVKKGCSSYDVATSLFCAKLLREWDADRAKSKNKDAIPSFGLSVTLAAGAIMPTRGTDGSAGYDLYAIEDVTINCFNFTLVSTGVSMAIPAGHYGRIAPRSGLAVKHGVMVGAGVIDSDYRGEIKVALATLNGVYEFKKGDRIAQIIIEPVVTPELVQVDSLDDSERGDGGFGSTGK